MRFLGWPVLKTAQEILSENLARIDELIDDAVLRNPQLICLPDFIVC